jgi:hypothetical protein
VTDLLTAFGVIIAGFLTYRSAGWFARLFSDFADRSERDGVIRYGGGLPGNKVWRENSPERFAFRIEVLRFSSAFTRLLFKAVGAAFVIGGIAKIIGSLFR